METNKNLNNFLLFDPLKDLHEKMDIGSTVTDCNYIDKPKPNEFLIPKRSSNHYILFDPLKDLHSLDRKRQHKKIDIDITYTDPNYIDKQNISCKPKSNNSSIPKRPSNPFILFRKWKWKQISKDYKKTNQSNVSIIIGRSWKNLSENEKEYWKEKAFQELKKHKQLYPNYKYNPKKKINKN